MLLGRLLSVAACFLVLSLTGCGDSSSSNNVSDYITEETNPSDEEPSQEDTNEEDTGTEENITISYPPEVTTMYDIAIEAAAQSFWSVYDGSLIQVDNETGELLSSAQLDEFSINHSSELAFDGQDIWATSYGWSNGVPQSFIYRIGLDGTVLEQLDCPATSTGGFCEGLAWDGTYLWTGASDNKNLVRYNPETQTTDVFENFWTTISRTLDLAYDPQSDQILAIKDNTLTFVSPQSGERIFEESYDGSFSNGDWDGSTFWFTDNNEQKIKSSPIQPAEE